MHMASWQHNDSRVAVRSEWKWSISKSQKTSSRHKRASSVAMLQLSIIKRCLPFFSLCRMSAAILATPLT